MAKKATIENKRVEMKRKLARLQVFEKILDKLDEMSRIEYLILAEDKDGNYIRDEHDNLVFIEPNENAWNYDEYIVFKSVVDEIMALI